MSMYKKEFLVIEAKGGIEEFPIATSICGTGIWGLSNIPEEEFCYSFCVECEGNPLPLLVGKDLAGYSPPHLEINYHSGSSEVPANLKGGEHFQIDECFSKRYCHQTNLYRISHEGIDKVSIDIVSSTKDKIEVKITGNTRNVAVIGDFSSGDVDDDPGLATIWLHTTMTLEDGRGPSFD